MKMLSRGWGGGISGKNLMKTRDRKPGDALRLAHFRMLWVEVDVESQILEDNRFS